MQYQATFLDSKPIFNSSELEKLTSLAQAYPISEFLADHRTFEERSIDYAYVSSKIEGNKYSRKGATMLLKYGFTEGGKTMGDAQMLVNLRDAFVDVALSTDEPIDKVLTEHYLCMIHSEVSGNLLGNQDRGTVRRKAVAIEGSEYIPLDNEYALKDQLSILLKVALTIENPFEQAVYVHCNLAYLQFFHDGNKRTARLMQTAILVANKITPVFFSEDAVYPYLNAIVTYNETGDYSLYKNLFLEEYENTIKHLLGQSPQQLRAQQLANESIQSQKEQ